MPLRIVLDTSVLIAGLGWRGTASRLVEAAGAGLFELVTTKDLLDELREKLVSPKFSPHLTKANLSADSAVALVARLGTQLPAGAVSQSAVRDPSDLHVLAAALAGADIIVSRDKDLLSLGSFEGIPIIGVEDCLHTLGLHG